METTDAVFTDSDSDSSSTSTTGQTTLGTTTSTVTTSPPTTGDVSTSTDGTSSTTDDVTTTSGGDECNFDGVCDEDAGEDHISCLHDCGTCKPDTICDASLENPFTCPADCPATACDLNGEVDNLSEQCDDGNADNNDDCTDTCTLNVCGDGYVNEAAGSMEECDDGNGDDGDGCNHMCIRETRIVFASSIRYPGDMTPEVGNKVGLARADAHCDALAGDANLPGKYMAWLSAGDMTPPVRFDIDPDFAGRFVLTNGSIIADGWGQLTSGVLLAAIDRDEKNDLVEPESVWTNTKSDGSRKGDSDCAGWTTALQTEYGYYGLVGNTDTLWTDSNDDALCSQKQHIYCFQVSD